jgi:hypothetical protein
MFFYVNVSQRIRQGIFLTRKMASCFMVMCLNCLTKKKKEDLSTHFYREDDTTAFTLLYLFFIYYK